MLSFKCVNDVYCRSRIKTLKHVLENGDRWGGVWSTNCSFIRVFGEKFEETVTKRMKSSRRCFEQFLSIYLFNHVVTFSSLALLSTASMLPMTFADVGIVQY